MENQDSQVKDSESRGSSRRIAFSSPIISNKKYLSGSRKSARFNDETNGNNPYIEITLDVANDSLLVHNIKGTPDQEAALIASRIEKHPSLSTQLSSKLRQISRDLKSSFSSSKRSTNSNNKVKHSASGAAQALMGLRFIHKNTGTNDGWSDVEARFDELSVDGLLPRSSFGKCIGIKSFFFFLD